MENTDSTDYKNDDIGKCVMKLEKNPPNTDL